MASTTCESLTGPRQVLAKLVQEQPALLNEPRRLEALLRDYCPQRRREILAIKLAQQERLVDELRRLEGHLPITALLSRLTCQMQEVTGLAEPLARWSIVSWACALGCLPKDSSEALATETLAETETKSNSNVASVAVATNADAYADILRSAQEALASARQASARSDALRLAETALQLGQEALRSAPNHVSLPAVVIQAKSEIARLGDELAQEALRAENASLASSYWQRVTEVAPADRGAASRLRQLEDERGRNRQDAEQLWREGKFPESVARWQELRRRWPRDADVSKACDERQVALAEVEQLCRDVSHLKLAGRVQRLADVYARLAILAPAVPGLTEAQVQLASRLQEAEPTLDVARKAMAEARYADVQQLTQKVLKHMVDHAAALKLAEQARHALSEYQVRLDNLRKAQTANDGRQLERIVNEFTAAELKLPELAGLRDEYGVRLRRRRARQWAMLGTTFGLIAWLGAWWLAKQTASDWPELARFVPGHLATDTASSLVRCATFGAFASFLLGIVAALFRGREGFRSVAVLIGITFAHGLVLWSIGMFAWLDTTKLPWLKMSLRPLLEAGSYGFWLGIAICCLTGIWDKLWALSGPTAVLAVVLWHLIGQSEYPLQAQPDQLDLKSAVFLAALLWMLAIFLAGWLNKLSQFALVPFGLGLAMSLRPYFAGNWSAFATPVAIGVLFALALLALTATRLTWPQIGCIWLLACFAAYIAQHFQSDYAWLAVLWCCAWLPRAIQGANAAAAVPSRRTPPPLPPNKRKLVR